MRPAQAEKRSLPVQGRGLSLFKEKISPSSRKRCLPLQLQGYSLAEHLHERTSLMIQRPPTIRVAELAATQGSRGIALDIRMPTPTHPRYTTRVSCSPEICHKALTLGPDT